MKTKTKKYYITSFQITELFAQIKKHVYFLLTGFCSSILYRGGSIQTDGSRWRIFLDQMSILFQFSPHLFEASDDSFFIPKSWHRKTGLGHFHMGNLLSPETLGLNWGSKYWRVREIIIPPVIIIQWELFPLHLDLLFLKPSTIIIRGLK